MVQGLRTCLSNAGHVGLIPGQELIPTSRGGTRTQQLHKREKKRESGWEREKKRERAPEAVAARSERGAWSTSQRKIPALLSRPEAGSQLPGVCDREHLVLSPAPLPKILTPGSQMCCYNGRKKPSLQEKI